MEASFAAIILMAGEGRRFGDPLPKQFHLLGSQKIYQITLETFLTSGLFQQIVLVCHPAWAVEVPPGVKVITGGPTRQASSYLGIQACTTDYVMIHDAVRPFVSQEILEKNKAAVLLHKAVDTCIPSADTLVYAPNGTFISSIPPRKEFLRGQTPQTFDRKLILEAHQKTAQMNATDDCSLILELGHAVSIVLGSEENIKITTEFDLELAQLSNHTQSQHL